MWAIWGDLNFLIPALSFIVTIIIAIYFECKYLDERKKNQCLMKYATKPIIAPLKPISVIQKATDGTCQSGLTPIGKITNPSAKTLPMKTKVTCIILPKFIKGIIRWVTMVVNHKQTEPLASPEGI